MAEQTVRTCDWNGKPGAERFHVEIFGENVQASVIKKVVDLCPDGLQALIKAIDKVVSRQPTA